jgi:cyclopropane-fatty-acyl-phospholipid synthase
MKRMIQDLFSLVGVTVDGPNPWDIRVNDDRFYARVLRDQKLGLGESYMDDWWDSPRLDQFIFKILSGRLDRKIRSSAKLLILLVRSYLFNLETKKRSREVAERHYDLGNDLFFSFLDPYRQYSCGYFNGTNDLEEAQLNKLDLICRKLGLTATDRVLDIGSGWGGLSKYAAERYGCEVTGVNISDEQIGYAREFCEGLPVRIVPCDYRDITGSFDKIVSVGMFEHVGSKNYRTFMEVVRRHLKEGGVFLLHTIGGNESVTGTDPWIAKYIFPNGMLPSIAQIASAVEGIFVLEDFHNLGPHYDRTLMAWHENFQRAWPQLESRYGWRFKRMWEYYLLSCAAAFRSRYIQVWQMVFTQYGTPQPHARI